MRRAALALAAALAAAAAPAAAQDGDTLQIGTLRAPTSPAFTILGVSPASVSRPSTPKAFALSLLSAGAASGVVPENYAVELTPYWMGPRRTLTWDQVYDPGPLQALRQTFSVSLATTSAVAGPDTLTRIGIGFRATPRLGRPGPAADSLVARLGAGHRARQDTLNARRLAREANDAATEARLTGWLQQQEAEIDALGLQLGEAMRGRVGWMVEVAGALAAGYPQDDVRRGRLDNRGAWVTVTHAFPGAPLDAIGVARYLRSGAGAAGQDVWDLGGRALVRTGQLGVSAEFVRRFGAAELVPAPPPGRGRLGAVHVEQPPGGARGVPGEPAALRHLQLRPGPRRRRRRPPSADRPPGGRFPLRRHPPHRDAGGRLTRRAAAHPPPPATTRRPASVRRTAAASPPPPSCAASTSCSSWSRSTRTRRCARVSGHRLGSSETGRGASESASSTWRPSGRRPSVLVSGITASVQIRGVRTAVAIRAPAHTRSRLSHMERRSRSPSFS
jgi:hypothetical protein